MTITHATESSRDAALLWPELEAARQALFARFAELHPSYAQPFLTQTSRSFADQAAAYASGRTKPGKVITDAPAGESLHNYAPALAFDVAFRDHTGAVQWTPALFAALGALAASVGLEWGGSWHHFQDHPHFQPQQYTWEMAAKNLPPVFPIIAIHNGTNPLASTNPLPTT